MQTLLGAIGSWQGSRESIRTRLERPWYRWYASDFSR